MGVDSVDHRNVEQQMLALGRAALMHGDLSEMLVLMGLEGTCITKCLSQIEHTM